MRSHHGLRIALAVFTFIASFGAVQQDAAAFCGFYVSGATKKMYNNATEVVMMREGTRTVLSMRNNYEGPPKDFAMVIPVPQVLKEENVKTLSDDLFEKIDTLSAPRLVEYWQQDPCYRPAVKSAPRGVAFGAMESAKTPISKMESKKVVVEAEFEVGEYEVVILSATESNALEDWLVANKYNIPTGASAAMAPYIAQGQYFFVAKVDPAKVKFKKGQAMLSPLRFHYDSEDFSLPVRLGLLNAKGHQDLIVHILARNQRYQVANYPNVTIPTNLIVPSSTRTSFAKFYTALFDYTLEQNPRAVVTEYSWDASTCDPCPGPTLNGRDFEVLGADVIDGADSLIATVDFRGASSPVASAGKVLQEINTLTTSRITEINQCYQLHIDAGRRKRGKINLAVTFGADGKVTRVERLWDSVKDEEVATCIEGAIEKWSIRSQASSGKIRVEIPLEMQYYKPSRGFRGGWTLTRLHTRYTKKTMSEDLIFEKAPGIIGGRGMPQGERGEMKEEDVVAGRYNNFQGRYIMLNRWKGKLTCKKEDRYYRWGGPVGPMKRDTSMMSATDTAFVPRGKVKLTKAQKKEAKQHYAAHKKAFAIE